MVSTFMIMDQQAEYESVHFKGDSLVLRNIQTGELFEMAADEELLKSLNIYQKDLDEISKTTVTEKSIQKEETVDQRWTDEATIALINLYATHEADWKNNKLKVDEVCKMIANEMKANELNFTFTQAKNKWKHLRKLYFKQNDNMGPTATGSSPYTFKFYDEMNNIYSDKPNVKPLAIASSSKGSQLDIDMIAKSVNSEERKRKAEVAGVHSSKVSKTEQHVIEWMSENASKKEVNRQKRHEENIQVQRDAIKAFSEAMDKICEKL